jgi:hypothetical protein
LHVSVVQTFPSSHAASVKHVRGAKGTNGAPMSPGASVIGGAIDIETRNAESSPSGWTRRANGLGIHVPPRLEA